jgi:translation elongation factor EF-Ts
MTTITAAMVAKLREQTDATMMDCKKALVRFDGDYETTLKWLTETPYHERRGAILDGRRCQCCKCK